MRIAEVRQRAAFARAARTTAAINADRAGDGERRDIAPGLGGFGDVESAAALSRISPNGFDIQPGGKMKSTLVMEW